LATIYAGMGEESGKEAIPVLLRRYDESLRGHEGSGAHPFLVLLGGAATKLGFNIKHKQNDAHDYDCALTERTLLTVQDIQSY